MEGELTMEEASWYFLLLISDKPELLISSFEHFSFCSAEALYPLNYAGVETFWIKMLVNDLKNLSESKIKGHNSRNKAIVAKVSLNSSTPEISPDVAALTTKVSELKNMMKTMLIE
ncbi:hypothetical protein Tco_0110478 [Tanacetum coccineum]